MFHSAFTRRMRLVTGRSSPVAGLTATKWPMPCWSGVFPVAIVVQMMGLRSGLVLMSRPYAPSCRSVAKCGSLPSDMRRSTTSGSMPSSPSTRTRGEDGGALQALTRARMATTRGPMRALTFTAGGSRVL